MKGRFTMPVVFGLPALLQGCGASLSSEPAQSTRANAIEQSCNRAGRPALGALPNGKTEVVLGQNIGQAEDTFTRTRAKRSQRGSTAAGIGSSESKRIATGKFNGTCLCCLCDD